MKKAQALGVVVVAVALLCLPLVAAAEDALIVPEDVDFGEVELGESATETVTVTSILDDELIISSISIDILEGSATSFAISSMPDIGDELGLGESVEIGVRFAPDVVGAYRANLVIVSNDSVPPVTTIALVGLAGEGVDPGGEPSARELMDELLEFFDAAVEADLLEGTGRNARARRASLALIRLKLELASRFIDWGLDRAACNMLDFVIDRSDGDDRPPDFVDGEAAPDFNGLAAAVSDALDCGSGGGHCGGH